MSNGSLELGGPGLISPVLPQVMQHLFQRWMFGSITQFVPQINALTSPCPIDLAMRGAFISCIKGFPHSYSSNVEHSPGYCQFWIVIKVPVCYHFYHAFLLIFTNSSLEFSLLIEYEAIWQMSPSLIILRNDTMGSQ